MDTGKCLSPRPSPGLEDHTLRRLPGATSSLPCDCCHAVAAWEYLFSESGLDLGRCSECGLHYVAQMPSPGVHMTEMEAGHFAGGAFVGTNAKQHLHSESVRHAEFETHVQTVRQFAPSGKWLDIGCGTGTLITLAKRSGREVEGIELTPDRRAVARQATGAPIHDRPIELLDFVPESFSVVTLINVFSHLASPSETLAHIRRVLSPGGVILLRTAEIGPHVKKHHIYTWGLGDHLYFLGENTIETYATKLGFRLVSRERTWLPATIYSREWFEMKGRSRIRNWIKTTIIHTPGALPLLRSYMLSVRQAGNPIYTSDLVLRKFQIPPD